ncbi:universal stress protein [Terrimonas pollutisoli]|uniref:universal stress protein n=1 Tax=Terrimonas pollutisoli TaxID=3034147 RepID=UPI0023EBE1DF|nr:universal stress protein [Terrimonas sp. H1YJ31]
MKKFIAAFDGLRFSESVMDYAILLAKQSSAHLVGVFLDDYLRHSYKIYDLVTKESTPEVKQKKLEEKDEATRAAAVSRFENACRQAGMNYSVHHDRDTAIHELLHESIYADLLIVNSSETLTAYTEKIPSEFIRDLLSHVQCPVLIVPQKFKPIEKLILLYDGEPTSVYAIKMFSYMLPSLKQIPTEVISVKGGNQTRVVPDKKLMKEFMNRRFPHATYSVFKGLPEIAIVNYLKKQKENSLVILGAYRRSTVSRWFRASMADVLMRDLKLPLFIAHNK